MSFIALLGADLHAADGVDDARRTRRTRSRRSRRPGCRCSARWSCTSSFGPPYANAALIFVVPWPGTSTIESRGIDISMFGPAAGVQQHDRVGAAALRPCRRRTPSCCLRVEPLAAVAADQEVRRPGLLAGAAARRGRVDLLDLRPRDQRHRDEEHQPQREHGLDPAHRNRRRPRDGARRRRWRRSGAAGRRTRRGRRSREAGRAGASGRGAAEAGAGCSRAGRRSAASGSARGRARTRPAGTSRRARLARWTWVGVVGARRTRVRPAGVADALRRVP